MMMGGKKMKRLLNKLIILTLSLFLVSCSSDEKTDADNTDENEINNAETAEEKYEELKNVESDENIQIDVNKDTELPQNEEEALEEIDDTTENPFNKIESISTYSFETDYYHVYGSDYIFLGNGEGTTVTVTAKPAGLEVGDIIFFDSNENILNITYEDAVSNYDKNTTELSVYITANQQSETQSTGLIIASSYDVFENENDADFYEIIITVYNQTDGRIVYVTENGEKYHYSKDCVNGTDKPTTLKEALAYEYEPCKKCVH